MKSIIDIKEPTVAIVAFSAELDRPMTHTVCYQAVLDPSKLSPSGEFMRFNHGENCELHGWMRVDEIEVLEVLEVLTETMSEAA